MSSHFSLLRSASSHLSRAEELYQSRKDYEDEAVKAVIDAYDAVAELLETDDILVVLPALPKKMWGELLRLNEIKRTIKDMNGKVLLETAREAVEIATALILYSMDLEENYT